MHVVEERVPRAVESLPVEDSVQSQVVLRTSGLTKHFGKLTAVDRLDLEVHRGEVVGLLGPNGAGKSTTVGMVLGLVAPSEGRIEITGRVIDGSRAPVVREVGAIIEQPAFYPDLSGRDNLRAVALAAGGVPAGRIDELLERVGLTDRASTKYKTYSLGMKQRLGIASTLLTDPALVILDEPANGLDPAGQREVRQLVPRLAADGHGVLLASHLLHEVEQVCNRVVIIRQGKLLASGSVRELLHRESYLEITVDEPNRALQIVRVLPFVSEAKATQTGLQIVAPAECGGALNRALADAGLFAVAIVPRVSSLEDVFFELTDPSEAVEGRGGNVPASAH